MQHRSFPSLPGVVRLALAASLLLVALACGGTGDASSTDADTVGGDTASPDDTPAVDKDTAPRDASDAAAPDDVDPDGATPPRECDSGADCDDDNRCTDELCLDHHCVITSNTLPCDDGDACTHDDTCAAGSCAGIPKECADANSCTTDGCSAGACTHKVVAGDECALRIDVTSPARGASVTAGGPLTLTGTITSPAAPIVAATLDGVPVDFTPDGAFSTPFAPVPGLNVIRLRVRDELGREADRVQSFLYGDNWAAKGTPAAPKLLPGAIDLWLRYDVLDDDDLSDLDDVATLVTRALDGLDLESQIPHPLTAEGEGPSALWCTWTIDVTDVLYDVSSVDFYPLDGSLWLSVTLTSFSAYVDAVAPEWFCPDAHGYVFADLIGIDAEVRVTVGSGGVISTAVPYVAATVEGIELALDGGAVSLFDWLLNWFSDSFATKIEDAVESWVPASLVPMLNGLLGDLATYQKALTLPAVAGNPPAASITAAVQAQTIDISDYGVHVTARAGAEVAATPPHATVGSLLRGDCLGADPDAFWMPEWDQVEAALSEDLMNRALWALWASGALNLTLDETVLGDSVARFNLKNVDLHLDPLLPPVVTSCSTPGQLELQVGDLGVTAAFDLGGGPGQLDLFGTLRIAVLPVLVDGAEHHELSLEVGEVQDLAFDVVHAEGTGTALSGLVETLLADVVRNVLLEKLVKDAIQAWPVPEIDLGAYVPGVPWGSVVTFDPETLAPVDHGHLLLGGTVVTP